MRVNICFSISLSILKWQVKQITVLPIGWDDTKEKPRRRAVNRVAKCIFFWKKYTSNQWQSFCPKDMKLTVANSSLNKCNYFKKIIVYVCYFKYAIRMKMIRNSLGGVSRALWMCCSLQRLGCKLWLMSVLHHPKGSNG